MEVDDAPSNSLPEHFTAVLNIVQHSHVKEFVLSHRREQHPSSRDDLSVALKDPFAGSTHILFPLKFNDGGQRWVIKIPWNGTPGRWDDMSVRELLTEAQTLSMIKKETSIPVPAVHAYSTTTENELGCPYILMDYIGGVKLRDLWFDDALPADAQQMRRTRALRELAHFMAQLDKFTFDHAGWLQYTFKETEYYEDDEEDSKLHPVGTSVWRVIDHQATIATEGVGTNDYGDEEPPSIKYAELYPRSETFSFYTDLLSHRLAYDVLDKGYAELLYLFMTWLPEPELGGDKKPFVLTHPLLDFRNIRVSNHGALRGIVGWSAPLVVPHSLGNTRYPLWLIGDYNPVSYESEVDLHGRVVRDFDGHDDYDTPQAMAFYRNLWDNLIAGSMYSQNKEMYAPQAVTRAAANDDDDDTSSTPPTSPATTSRNSLIAQSLSLAALYPEYTRPILGNLFGEITRILGKGPYRPELDKWYEAAGDVPGDLSDDDSISGTIEDRDVLDEDPGEEFEERKVVTALALGVLDETRLGWLRDGFMALLA
ncbi:hypothetical protein AJ80_08116 [Polytolypa hystricis UAMH7299]|uniref:Aminoglycoside phosphotransferase domain-containing protein n=1 Tax=Polytolypa hystricis (strain UAMH7299) TaxID=1447883 RepID=A0A2B7XCP8_POLH7|nr:hypothetical protein AJ80_08116 [Polytolypa hystricis UAMH7299]